MKEKRTFPIGAEVLPTGVHFRLWAPECDSIEVVLNGNLSFPMKKDSDGYFYLLTKRARPGDLYQFRLNEEPDLLADPASRFQPLGPDGPSCIWDPHTFTWSDGQWKKIPSLHGQVIYEMHIGTFTHEGTWLAASSKLEGLSDLGITLIEMMPIADFSGEFGWGYDGVSLFAPSHLYGTPDDLKNFIQRAHALGIGVILDVVYNHFGPSKYSIAKFSLNYFNGHMKTDWGTALNFDGKQSAAVREFCLSNALYWIDEFHFDGLRLDATQNIYDISTPNIHEELTNALHKKKALVIAENEPQETKFIQPREEGGYEMDGLWNDDFHHSALVRLTGRKEAYYTDYQGSAQEFISAFKYGYLFQGQHYSWQMKNRGTPMLHEPYEKMILFLENHDQIANSTRCFRLHQMSDPGVFRLMTTLLILAPATPLLFQGQEFGSTAPFCFFADYEGFLSHSVWDGRKQFLSQFSSFPDPEIQKYFPDPCDRSVFLKCKLNWEEKDLQYHQSMYQLHKDLIHLRLHDPVFSNVRKIDGAVITPDVFLLRFFGEGNEDRLIICNFGKDAHINSISDPLYAPPMEKEWKVFFSSQHPQYGGVGSSPYSESGWTLSGHTALIFIPIRKGYG